MLGYVEVAYASLSNIAYCKIINAVCKAQYMFVLLCLFSILQAGTPTNPDPTGIQSAMNDFPLQASASIEYVNYRLYLI